MTNEDSDQTWAHSTLQPRQNPSDPGATEQVG